MIYFWSDTHFNHRGIIDYCKRPYASVEEMNAGIIARWNSVIRSNDEIFLLGDFGFGNRGVLVDIFGKLQGRKHLILGNHDKKNQHVAKLGWESVRDMVVVRHEGHRAVCCHYPIESWEGAHRGYLMLHGHSHGSLKRFVPHRFDVGCDVFQEPVRFQDLVSAADQQTFQASDHHGDL
jgi:calcineurin-like phosphoesterase family protein